MAQLAYHVSMGLPLWDYPVHKGTVLYLALEDDHRRLQERLYRMFGMDGTNDLLFSICAKQVGNGLEEQLKRFVQEHPDTKLIIIDTLQKIREAGGDKYSYANDYEVVGKLKRLADACGVCLLLVHHTRKQQADDKFDMISGTNGLMGAADGAFLLQKERRTDSAATLDISGRDLQDQRLYLKRDEERLAWELERRETEPYREPPDPVLEAVAALVTVPFALSYRYYGSDEFILNDQTFVQDTGTNSVMYYAFDTTDEANGDMEAFLQDYTENVNPELDYESKATYAGEFESMRSMFLLLGGTLSFIVGLVGVLNFFNAILTGIIARQRELAVLQAVGMTGKQMRSMLIWEGLLYALGAAGLALLLTLALGPVAFQAVEGLFWFFTYHLDLTPFLLIVPLFALLGAGIPVLTVLSLIHI